ncbi:MAG: glycosyltransferase [Opitutales bacterium]
MRVCHVLAGSGTFGGLEKNVVDLTSAQSVLGLEVSVLTTSALAGFFDERVNVSSVRLDRSRFDPRLRYEIKKQLLLLQPDIVHAHANKSAATIGKLVNGMGLKSVATVQNIKKNQDMFRHFDAVIAASQVVAESLGGLSAKVIRNAVNRPDFSLKQQARALNPPFLDRGQPVLYAAGRFVKAKGYDYLLQAMEQITDVSLWLVGDGPDRAMLENMVADKTLADRVWMPGFLPVEQVLGLMTLADIFVISSRREGGPYTLAEALRYRCPVISTRVGFAPELLGERQLINETSVEGLVAGLKHSINDINRYREEMLPIYERADRELDIDLMVEQVLVLYRDLLSR